MRRHGFAHFLILAFFLASVGGLSAQMAAGAAEGAVTGATTLRHDIRPGAGVTHIAWLSAWFAPLAGSPADTQVYILEGKEKGGTVFLVGGTHANEIAGIMTAILLIERARVTTGRLIVIPNANNSAATWDERATDPAWIALGTPSGTRFFKYGSRLTHPVHENRPDPVEYLHPTSSERLPGEESRNLDRAYPGNAEGSLTSRLAFAILTLIQKEKVDVAFDLHEAGPESRLANMIVANPKNIDTGAMAKLDLEMAGLKMSLEPSSKNFRGLSHREWGDFSRAAAFLIETPNPGQGNHSSYDVVNDAIYPLSIRVATHLATVLAILDAHALLTEDQALFAIENLPDWRNLVQSGIGKYLQ